MSKEAIELADTSEISLIESKKEDLLLADMGLNVKDEEDKKQLKQILFDIGYPSSEMAHLHARCDRLGNHDVSKDEAAKALTNTPKKVKVLCMCCGFREQSQTIPTCTPFDKIPRLGQSTDLYFMMIKHTIYLMLIMSVIYAGYSLYTNIQASGQSCKFYVVCSLTAISEGAKQINPTTLNKTSYVIQSWLGVAMTIIFTCYFMFMSYKERKIEIESDNRTKSASDFSLMFENLPTQVTQKRLQEIFSENFKNIRSIRAEIKKEPIIVKFNVAKPYYLNENDFKDDELQNLRDEYKKELETLRDWIRERIDDGTKEFRTHKKDRQAVYEKIKKLKKDIVDKSQAIAKKIEAEVKVKRENVTTQTVFVTVRNSLACKMISKLNSQHINDKIRRFFTSIRHNETLPLQDTIVTRAPEPQDIIWMNIGVPGCETFWRKFLTFTGTFVMLGISFVILYGLSLAQVQKSADIAISIAISIVIQVINVVITVVIVLLTQKERNFTLTNYQRSLAMKIIFAQLLNMIIVPMIVNYFIKNKVYETGGLIEDVFFMAVTNAILAPLMRFIDIGYFIKKLLAKFHDRPVQRLKLSQQELNAHLQGLDFEIGLQYVYAIKTVVFTAFFVSLMPVISVLALIGIFFMYWAEKYVLLNRSKRPPPGSDIINSTMSQLVYLSPVIFGLGSLTWPIFMPSGSPKESLIPNLITIGIAIFFFIVPLETICDCCIKKEDEANSDLIYQKERIFFTAQYDRRNPDTMAEGIKDYTKYLEDQKQRILDNKEDQSTEASQLKEQLNNVIMQNVVKTQGNGFAGGNLFFTGGPSFHHHPHNSGFNPWSIMQIANAPVQQYQPMMPAQIVHPQPMQPQGMGYPQFVPQQQPQIRQQVYPQPQPQPQFMQPQMGFGFNNGNQMLNQMQQFGFSNPQSFGFNAPQFGFGFNGGFRF